MTSRRWWMRCGGSFGGLKIAVAAISWIQGPAKDTQLQRCQLHRFLGRHPISRQQDGFCRPSRSSKFMDLPIGVCCCESQFSRQPSFSTWKMTVYRPKMPLARSFYDTTSMEAVHQTKSNYQCGFSLIELMVVVAMVAIVTAIATPNYKQFLVSSEIRSAVNDFSLALQTARSEAVRQRTRVRVCPSSDGAECATTATDAYEAGWIITMMDSATPDGLGRVIQDFLPLSRVTMTANKSGSVIFLTNGLPAGNFAGFRITVQENSATPNPSLTRYICVARTGRARVFTETQYLALANSECS